MSISMVSGLRRADECIKILLAERLCTAAIVETQSYGKFLGASTVMHGKL